LIKTENKAGYILRDQPNRNAAISLRNKEDNNSSSEVNEPSELEESEEYQPSSNDSSSDDEIEQSATS
jgi:hypothetical protein